MLVITNQWKPKQCVIFCFFLLPKSARRVHNEFLLLLTCMDNALLYLCRWPLPNVLWLAVLMVLAQRSTGRQRNMIQQWRVWHMFYGSLPDIPKKDYTSVLLKILSTTVQTFFYLNDQESVLLDMMNRMLPCILCHVFACFQKTWKRSKWPKHAQDAALLLKLL